MMRRDGCEGDYQGPGSSSGVCEHCPHLLLFDTKGKESQKNLGSK